MSNRDTLIDWLRDAYAMERGLEITLKKQMENGDLHDSLRQQAQLHLIETSRHAELVKVCLESLGADPSVIKTGIAQVMETVKGIGTAFADDERVKDVLVAYGTEHFEIACYTALRAAAVTLGENQIVDVCDQIIPDEQRMADWLEENLPVVVTAYLQESRDR